MMKYLQAGLICVYFFAATTAFAAAEINFYRYTNEKGEVILSNQVPPDQVVRGYDVLDKNGQIKETIAPALTNEQRQIKIADEARKASDKRLIGLYSSYDEIDNARDARIAQIDSAIVLIEGNIRSMIDKREKLQKSGADLERDGKTVPVDIAQQLFVLDSRIKSENKKLVDQQDLRKSEMDRFAIDRVRLGELRQLAGSTTIPETELRTLTVMPSNP
jgi:hypothetical protein